MFRKSLAIAVLIVAASGWSAGTTWADVPNVVVSIKPVHSLAAGVMNGIAKPTLLIEGGASPHAYSLRPSEAEALQNADVVFWIGEEMETFLEKPLEALPEQARVVALHQADRVVLLPLREGGAWEAHADRHTDQIEDHGHADEHSQKHADKNGDEHKHSPSEGNVGEHAHGEENMHIWLNPANATAMVSRMVAVMSEVDPTNALRYRTNGNALKSRLAELDSAISRELEPVKTTPYVVFHDAYQYFEERYDLTPVGSITVDPDRKPGVHRVREIRKKIQDSDAVCVFSEPQFEPALVDVLTEGTNAKTAILDPLGADISAGADAYFQLMRDLAASLRGCLRQSS